MGNFNWNELSPEALKHKIESIFRFQFGEELTQIFLEDYNKMTFQFSRKTGKIRYIYIDNQLEASYRSNLGLFSLSLHTAQRIIKKLSFPKSRIQVLSSISSFIKEGKSVFAKHVVNYDNSLHVGDEVFVVDEDDNLLAIGKLEVPVHYLKQLKSGMAVNVKKGINKIL